MTRPLAILMILTFAVSADAQTLLDFGATWCAPCNQVAPVVDQLSAKGFPVRRIDVDREPDVAARYKITSIPAFVVVDGQGVELARRVGGGSAAQLGLFYNTAIAAARIEGTAIAAPPSPSPANPKTIVSKPSTYQFDEASGNPAPWSTVVRVKGKTRGKLGGETLGIGTGTVIDGNAESALVLTAAHVLEDGATLSVELFGPTIDAKGRAVGGWQAAFPATFVAKDKAADVGLLRFRPGHEIPSSPLADEGWEPSTSEPLASVGCSKGDSPSSRSERYVETHAEKAGSWFVCATLPHHGRSGGGLFDQSGRLVGLCDFQSPTDGKGLYATTAALRSILRSNNLIATAAGSLGVPKPPSTPAVTVVPMPPSTPAVTVSVGTPKIAPTPPTNPLPSATSSLPAIAATVGGLGGLGVIGWLVALVRRNAPFPVAPERVASAGTSPRAPEDVVDLLVMSCAAQDEAAKASDAEATRKARNLALVLQFRDLLEKAASPPLPKV